jgi:drug/metabolite transporter (DMT)-like permease
LGTVGERPRATAAVHGALLVVQIAFASQAVEGKLAMMPRALGGEAIAPAALAMSRMIGALVFFQIAVRAAKKLTPTTRLDQAKLAGLSVFGVALNQALFLLGLRTTSPVSAALLSVTIPIFTAGLAVLLRQERASARLVAGLAIAVCGVLWLTGVTHVDEGAVLVALNSLCYATYLVLAGPMIRRLGAFTVVTWIFLWGAIAFAPFGLPELVRAVPAITPRGFWLLAYVLVVPTIVAYSANAWALGRSTPILVTAYIFLQPLLAAWLAWVQLGQAVTERIGVAALLIVAGVAVVATRPRYDVTTIVTPGAVTPE